MNGRWPSPRPEGRHLAHHSSYARQLTTAAGKKSIRSCLPKGHEQFNFKGSDVRVTDQNGNAWFIAKDVCQVLGFRDAWNAIKTSG